jgi:hypothetical protein
MLPQVPGVISDADVLAALCAVDPVLLGEWIVVTGQKDARVLDVDFPGRHWIRALLVEAFGGKPGRGFAVGEGSELPLHGRRRLPVFWRAALRRHRAACPPKPERNRTSEIIQWNEIFIEKR